MKFCKYILLLTLLFPLTGYAQEYTISGIVYKKNASQRLGQAVITNMKTNVIMMSDELGVFNIKASKGDTLVVNHIGYSTVKKVITGANDIIVYMQPVVNLSVVTIKGQTKQQELNDIMADYRSKGTYYNGKPPAWSFLNSPLTGLYELFGKTPNQARRFQEYSAEELRQDEVNRRYNPSLVKRVTNLPDSAVRKFMDSYKPDPEDVKSWSDYELIEHIKRAYKYYEENKDKNQPKEDDLLKGK